MNVVLKLSKLCNLRCTYCYEYDHLADPARMPLEGLDSFFESLGSYWAKTAPRVKLHFALHGGEPLLLPPEYLRGLVDRQRRHLGSRGIPFRNAVQTNLYRFRPETLATLEELDIGIGVSLDVHGGQRVDAQGSDAEARVRRNLDALLASDIARHVDVGGISVLHAGNADRATDTFRFFATRGLDYRILPIFCMTEPEARMRRLMLTSAQVVAALREVAHAQLAFPGRRIRVYPLEDYLESAVRKAHGIAAPVYRPARAEWALIVDTNGDAYNHSEAYDPRFRFGNVFEQPLEGVMASAARHRLVALRAERAKTCERCAFGAHCSRLPVMEALASEREFDARGAMTCAVAQPMIECYGQLIAQMRTPRARGRGGGKRYAYDAVPQAPGEAGDSGQPDDVRPSREHTHG